MISKTILVLFALKTEARAFEALASKMPRVRLALTGLGWLNAERSVRTALAGERPGLVLSCGFAGGLNPEVAPGTVVYAAQGPPELERALASTGARPVRFHCAKQVIGGAAEKRAAWLATGADAIEMESQVICAICREQQIPCATVRVILDGPGQDLPLDFNRLMTPDQRLDPFKLALALAKSPGRVGALLELQKQSRSAARRLAEVLAQVVGALGPDA